LRSTRGTPPTINATRRSRTTCASVASSSRAKAGVAQEFTDHAISGATLLRFGFQALMRDALNRHFDVVLAESLDRFSRDQEDTAGVFKRLTFAGVNIVTLAEGDITHLHIGCKGTAMNALFLKDLAEKTHRGCAGAWRLAKPVADCVTAIASCAR
jgi:DNA invertase Pin-like site-specific DNA recombinase